MGRETRDGQRFVAMVKQYPGLASYWDFDKWEFQVARCAEEFSGLSSGEQVMLSFFSSVWFGNNRDFDITRAAGVLDTNNKKLIAAWLLDPFWP